MKKLNNSFDKLIGYIVVDEKMQISSDFIFIVSCDILDIYIEELFYNVCLVFGYFYYFT